MTHRETAIGSFQPLTIDQEFLYGRYQAHLSPSIHIDEVRTVRGEKISGTINPKAPCHDPEAGPHRYAHRSQHLCPHTALDYTAITPEFPDHQEPSVTLQDSSRDWHFLARHRDLVFDNKRIQLADSPWDKIRALAEDIWTFRRVIQKPGGNTFEHSTPWSHPVDSLMYGSWCLGGAYALIGLCATLGIRAREISLRGHSATEVWLNGKWCFVESIQRFAENGGTNMVDASFAEVRLAPTDPAYGFCAEQQQMYFQTRFLSSMCPNNGLWLQQLQNVSYCPETALAMYPYWTEPRFKSDQPERYELVPRFQNAGGAHEALILRQGQAFARRFWIGSLSETKTLTATFEGAGRTDVPTQNVPEDGGNWFIAVNDKIYPIRDLGGWSALRGAGGKTSPWQFSFELPLAELTEHAYNMLAIGCDGSGTQFLRFHGAGNAALPAETCFCPRLGE